MSFCGYSALSGGCTVDLLMYSRVQLQSFCLCVFTYLLYLRSFIDGCWELDQVLRSQHTVVFIVLFIVNPVQ